MKYQQPTFTAPVSNGKLTQEEYEIAVGKRNPKPTKNRKPKECLGCGFPLGSAGHNKWCWLLQDFE